MKIGFLGYGEAARAFHEGLKDAAAVVLAHDILLLSGDEAMREAMSVRGAQIAETAAALGAADLIFSAVTADQSLLAVQPLLPHLGPGHVFVDINSVSPERKRQTAAAVEAAGANYIDMAVMAPVLPRKHRTPVLLAGPAASQMLPEFLALGFTAEIAGDAPGAATAIKMVRSVFVKGLEAITVEALLAARASGCFDEILASLSSSYPGLDWPHFAEYQMERTTRHGRRRAAEMHESAATLDALGLHGGLAVAIAAVQERMGACGVTSEQGLKPTVDHVLARRLARSP
ncbi:6-phosphogluconate dehydrogenase [Mesorhizobium sp. L-8-10]|uniref:NAD(P)-dependent oxidoreductase n=1 Tax=Mesorhizobium sp. L-8-10 TaxID=2744523 RepID=UPI001926BAE7|nr:NAD(P)-dependent oxidoreductase [Mesorhizobium sp. L-8-10]BCH30693.1 6-phosphogluconate dehydrogenase [Mesorhizobium sp. L-8-10]